MTGPVSNDADKPAANTSNTSGSTKATNPTENKTKSASRESGGVVKARLLARSWLCPVEDDNGKLTFLRYSKGDEVEISEDVFENLAGPNAFKPVFARVDGDSDQAANS